MVKIRPFILIIVILPLFLSFIWVPYFGKQHIKIKDDQFPYQSFHYPITGDADNVSVPNIVARILGLSLGLDWYKVCITNNSFVKKNDEIIPKEDLSESFGSVRVEIYPFRRNQILTEQYDFLKTRNWSFVEEGRKWIEYSIELLAKPGEKKKCKTLLTEEQGFFYSIPSVTGFGSITIPPREDGDYLDDFSINQGDNVYTAKWNNTEFYVEMAHSAVWAKRIVFILACWGFVLMIAGIKKVIVKKEEDIN